MDPIRSVRALREAADIMEIRGGNSIDARIINSGLSAGGFADSDGQRLLDLLIEAAIIHDPLYEKIRNS